MSRHIIYRPLLHIHVLHGFYLHPTQLRTNKLPLDQMQIVQENLPSTYDIHQLLEIAPSPETKKKMDSLKVKMINLPAGLSLVGPVIEVDKKQSLFKPKIALPKELVLRFVLKVRNTSFLSITEMAGFEIGKKFFFFSNQANNTQDSTLFLNRPGRAKPARYASGKDIKKVNEKKMSFLPTKAFEKESVLAVLEIGLDQIKGPYSLLDQEGNLSAPTYTLWWQNKLVQWRYIFNNEQATPSPQCKLVLAKNKTEMLTKHKLPLIDRRLEVFFCLKDKTEKVFLPNPEIRNLVVSDKKIVYASIQLGNLSLAEIVS